MFVSTARTKDLRQNYDITHSAIDCITAHVVLQWGQTPRCCTVVAVAFRLGKTLQQRTGMMARLSEWAQKFGLWVEPVTGQPGETVYRVTDIFTTRDGSWEPSDAPGSVPQWARDAYLKPWGHPQYFDDAGAAQNLFGGIAMNGNMIPHGTMHFWTYTDNSNHTDQRVKLSGWANIPLWPSSSYVPDRGEHGPWAWQPKGVKADVVKGGGLPQRWHVSMFAVWSPVTLPVITSPIEPPVVPLTLEQRVARLERLWEESQAGK